MRTETLKALSVWLLPAVVSGLLLGLAFPPVDVWPLAWIALVPLLWALQREKGRKRAFLMGGVTGTIMFLLVLYPLVSAHLWSGWEAVEKTEISQMKARQAIALHVLWMAVSAFVGVFWGVFCLALSRLTKGSVLRMALFAPPLLILLPEWLRALAVWDFQWGFLGNAAIDVPGILQLGALGGVWLLSWIVVLVNVAVLALISPDDPRQRWMLPATVAGITLAAAGGGLWWSTSVPSRLSSGEGIAVAALQYHQDRYTQHDYSAVGLERAYLALMTQAARGDLGDIELLVLPESVSYVPLSLDGSRKPGVPDEAHRSMADWQRELGWALGADDKRFDVILGTDTVERGELHNTMVFWNRAGLQGAYHKQGLVPFAEYQPSLLGMLGIRGRVQYAPGADSRIVTLGGMKIGAFICQEVLIPKYLRRSVRDGAQLLISGGNDGVFINPAVAEVHAKLARLRAVETGRYIIRAMKTGISAVIAPNGQALHASPGDAPFVVKARVQGRDGTTPYVRFGDWPLGVALLVILSAVVLRRDHR